MEIPRADAAHMPFVIAGPCVVESEELLHTVASTVADVCNRLALPFIFKASYRKANRSSVHSFTGIGDTAALQALAAVRTAYNVPVLTDIHTPDEAAMAAEYVDVLQIPAFLCRQTELLQAAGETGKIVNIKKGQFLAADDMQKAVDKVRSTGNERVWVTERGTMFGYHDLVVDFRSLLAMRSIGCPVVYDATHSLQLPGAGEQSGGKREYIPALARAAAAVGIDGLFFETHPDPNNALSDSATQLPLEDVEAFLQGIVAVHTAVHHSASEHRHRF